MALTNIVRGICASPSNREPNMYYLVVKGQIVGFSDDLDFLAEQQLIYGGEIKPWRK